MNSDDTKRGGGRGIFWDAALAVVALVGLLDASYLTVEHMTGQSVRCMIVTGCDEVLQSKYATFGHGIVAGGIPVAALGALAYFAVFSLATLAAFGYDGARRLVAPLVALMFLATLWFFYLQAFVIHAFCAYCLLSAAVTTTLTLLVVVRAIVGRKNGLA
jgi:uncharacterized membrane protein